MKQIQAVRVIADKLFNVSHTLGAYKLFDIRHLTHAIDFIATDKKAFTFFIQFRNSKAFLYDHVALPVLEMFDSLPLTSFADIYHQEIGGYSFAEVENFFIEPADLGSVESEYKKLLHHKDTTVGLVATDQPGLLVNAFSGDVYKKNFFEITY